MTQRVTETYNVRKTARKGETILRIEGPDGLPRLMMIPELGACVYSWQIEAPQGGPVELLYPGTESELDAAREAGILFGFPYLFPFANRVFHQGEVGYYIWEGRRHPMPIHGFSNSAAWEVDRVETRPGSASVVLALENTPETMANYPWAFRVELTYTLRAKELDIHQKVWNRGDSPMPLSPGWHPYFRAPISPRGSKGDCVLCVPGKTELGIDPRTCNMNGESFPFSRRRMTLAEHGPTGHFITDLSEPRASLHDPAAGIGIELDLRGPDGAPAWPHILTWTDSDAAPFFCIEPYEGVTNAVHNGRGLRVLTRGTSYATRLVTRVV